jgi:hypothetical protein
MSCRVYQTKWRFYWGSCVLDFAALSVTHLLLQFGAVVALLGPASNLQSGFCAPFGPVEFF